MQKIQEDKYNNFMSNRTNFPDLPKISLYGYEDFFNIYEDSNNTRFYNLLRSINIFPANDSSVEDTYTVLHNDTWLFISYKYYNTINLWWLVCEYNQIKNPTTMPEPGIKIKLLKPEYVWVIISELNKQTSN
jgi:hypothetical protein